MVLLVVKSRDFKVRLRLPLKVLLRRFGAAISTASVQLEPLVEQLHRVVPGSSPVSLGLRRRKGPFLLGLAARIHRGCQAAPTWQPNGWPSLKSWRCCQPERHGDDSLSGGFKLSL